MWTDSLKTEMKWLALQRKPDHSHVGPYSLPRSELSIRAQGYR